MRLVRLVTCRRLVHTVLAALLAALVLMPGADRAWPWQAQGRVRSADQPKAAAKFELKPGDHVSIIGNTLADRMQRDGWLETYFHSRFPEHDLVFRNLGFSADEVALSSRLRSASFGSPDKWLTFTKTDVVFAFFGYNESFAGEAGLDKFKKELDAFVKYTVDQKYNGKTNARLVLFSPVAHENLHDRNLPDGKDNNKRLELYTKAMAEVAKDNGVPFVDLFHPTQDAYAKAPQPLTINGVHLNEKGNEAVARIIDEALFPGAPGKRDAKALEKIRAAVVDRNQQWYDRYRTTDGYSIYGGRADEPKTGQRNREPMAREMEVLDVMTANRDKAVWAAAKGQEYKIDDGNTPEFIEVKTNKPGPLAGGAYLFLSGEEAISKMTVAKNLKVTLWADESMFPELAKPVQMAFDAKGRLWVAAWPTYPHFKPKEQTTDKLLILEDTKGTGKADKCTVFADGLHNPTGFEFYNGGVIVAQAPDILFLKDSKGGDKADTRVRLLSGMDTADTHHTSNSFTLDPGGALYWQEGTFHHTQVETPYGPAVRCVNAGVYRYEPRTQKFDVYVTTGFANPHGHIFDRWGQDIVIDGTGADPYHGTLFSGHLDYPAKHPKPPRVYDQKGVRPCPGCEILTSTHFPAEWQGNLLVPNVIGFQGIRRFKLQDSGSSFVGIEQEPLVSSSDPNFRPSDLKVGPDGAIYFTDWQNPLIGHLQHNLRDPSRDRVHGRIYKITYVGNEPSKSPKIDGEPIEKLLDALKSPEDRVRYRAKIELGGRNSGDVIQAVLKWKDKLDPKDADYEHHLMEALWLHQYHNVVNADLLKRMLTSKDFHARAAATRVLCYWRDRVPDALELLKRQAADEHPRVRLEAIRAASFFTEPEAIEVVFIANDHPTDQYLDFTRTETMKQIEPIFQKAVKEGKKVKFTTAAGARYFLKSVSTDDLLKLDRTDAVYVELLFRRGVRDEYRREALTGLAKSQKKKELAVLVETIRAQDGSKSAQDESVAFDLVRLLTSRDAAELKEARPELEKMATESATPLTRELGYVALIAADDTVDKAWALALKSAPALQDLVNAMPLVRDPAQRAQLYQKVEPLLDGLPKGLSVDTSKEVKGRYVRVELPGQKKTLTLAEVEVYSGGRNVARQGKASQSSTANGGDASKAIDGNTSGKWSDGGQTHTKENENNPWWEVDLKSDFSVESIVIYNRDEDDLGKRLNGFTLKVLDKDRKVVFEKTKLPAPAPKAAYAVGTEPPERAIRRAAMYGLTSVRGKESDAFNTLAKYVKKDETRADAVAAALRIPVKDWPKEEAQSLLENLLAYIAKVPTSERTSDDALNVLQFADNLASLLPLEKAKAVRKQLGELGVRVVRVGTLPEQMSYDKDRIVVKAGKPFEIVFENSDLMPHNLVVTQPGALEKIGTLAEETAQEPGALARHYVPKAKEILFKSRLLNPREVQRLSLTAPATPGVYPVVCTYPGHWRRMYAALYVVEDLDEYLADAQAYLEKHPLGIKDELLKFNRPRTEWKYDELVDEVKQLKNGRSFTNAKYLFQVASCVGCHKMNGVGNEFGPDLTNLDAKQDKLEEILRDVLEPSFRINEKYQSYKFDLKSGKTITGLLLETTPKGYKIIENPLAKAEPIFIEKDQVDEMTKSPVSIMPKGLLDKLTKEEILDLIAYVKAKGDAKHPLFQGGHEHHH